MKEKTFKLRGSIFLAIYDHKHGSDYSIHKTKDGATDFVHSCVDEYRDSFVDRNDHHWNSSTEELADNWHQITGGCESFDVLEINMED